MASGCLSEDLTCSICLSLFTEPVVLPCGHSFCRDCITMSLDKHSHCPQCRSPVDTKTKTLSSNHVLKGLVERVKETTKQKQEYLKDKERAEFLCPEHDEKMKLFCITDQQLICVICRDSHKHERHTFKPVSEAAALVKSQLQGLAKNICEDTKALETLVKSQQKEIQTTKQRSKQLQTLISSSFENMYTFLQKREKELKEKVTHQEEEALQKMTERLGEVKAAKAENQKLQKTVTTAIKITDPEGFLKMWSGQSEAKAAQGSFRHKSGNFYVEKREVSLGPYESHLQVFVWKEMVQVLQPREEHLSLKSDQTSLSVSQDKSAAVFHQTKYTNATSYNSGYNSGYGSRTPLPNSTQSTNTFAGQHYWEVYVGAQNMWELGVSETYLKYNSDYCQIHSSGRNTSLNIQDKPKKVGLYLDCPRRELSFYNADTMKLLHTERLTSTKFPVSAHFGLGNTLDSPLVVCTYGAQSKPLHDGAE